MKTIKEYWPLAVLTALMLVMGLTGCTHLKDPNTGPKIQSAVYVAAYVGTSEALRAHPEWRGGFELASKELAILEAGKIDVLKLVEIVKRLPVKELKGDRARIIIDAATILLVDQIGATPLEKLEDLKPIVTAIRRGIARGLGGRGEGGTQ